MAAGSSHLRQAVVGARARALTAAPGPDDVTGSHSAVGCRYFQRNVLCLRRSRSDSSGWVIGVSVLSGVDLFVSFATVSYEMKLVIETVFVALILIYLVLIFTSCSRFRFVTQFPVLCAFYMMSLFLTVAATFYQLISKLSLVAEWVCSLHEIGKSLVTALVSARLVAADILK